MDGQPILSVENLTHSYGRTEALRGVSFQIRHGEIVGLLGLNGAGKTTCLRILTGVILPDGGSIHINQRKMNPLEREARSLIGYLPENPPLYPELTVGDTLRFVAGVRGVSSGGLEEALQSTIKKTGLSGMEHRMVASLSLGYRKRLGIAQAIIGNPPLVFLDEPVSGLDPRQIVEIRKLILDLKGTHTLIISSHILGEVIRTCDRVFILHRGEYVRDVVREEMADLERIFLSVTETAGGNP